VYIYLRVSELLLRKRNTLSDQSTASNGKELRPEVNAIKQFVFPREDNSEGAIHYTSWLSVIKQSVLLAASLNKIKLKLKIKIKLNIK
jgi:hypothetical protein